MSYNDYDIGVIFCLGGHTTSDKSIGKKAHILECAEKVFVRKGFSSVTMKDIIDESEISRGGIYLYFKSVDEVFTEVVKIHNARKLENIKVTVKNSGNPEELIDGYFGMQKNKLLHMDKSLRRAMLEFFLLHKEETPENFITDQFSNSKKIIVELLKNNLRDENDINDLANLIMLETEGLETMALSCDISPELIDAQFILLKKLILERRNK